MSNNRPCEQCPWRLANQGKRHKRGFYTKANLTRLWNEIRSGVQPQSCHLTDPSHPYHIEAGCAKNAQVKECPGSVILVLREARLMAVDGAITDESVAAYQKTRRRGLKKTGILYWIIQRLKFAGIPLMGGDKLPSVDEADPEIGLPEYLKD